MQPMACSNVVALAVMTMFRFTGQAASHGVRIHSISGIAYYRESETSKPVLLDRKKDAGKVLKPHSGVSCADGGKVTLDVAGRAVVWEKSSWYNVLDSVGPNSVPDPTKGAGRNTSLPAGLDGPGRRYFAAHGRTFPTKVAMKKSSKVAAAKTSKKAAKKHKRQL